MSEEALDRLLAALRVLRGNPWYDISIESTETLVNVLRREGETLAFYCAFSSDPPAQVRKVILSRTAEYGNVTAPTALFKIERDVEGAERVSLTPRGRRWKRKVLAHLGR